MKAKSVLVNNEAAAASAKATKPVAEVQRFVMNLLPKQVRTEKLEGRSYTVVPMVMLTEGVFNGTSGPLYYGEEELSKTPQAWDHKPIVVYHTEESACTPDAIENRKVGIILNTKFDAPRKRLMSEAWIENEKADKVDPRVMLSVNGNEIMEVSTGVFVDNEQSTGDFGGRIYTGVARNLRPDHLALLPDQTGACSVADGAGLCRNAARKDPTGKLVENFRKMLREMGLVENELSFDNIRADLTDAIRKRLSVTATSDMSQPWPWVMDVYSNFFVYDYNNKLFQLSYAANDTGITLGDESPKEVRRVTKYESVAGAFVGNRDQSNNNNTMKLKPEEKKAKIDALIANKETGWSEDQRPVLEQMKDEQLLAQEKAFVKKEEPATTTTTTTTTNQQQADAKKALVDSIINKNDYGWTESDRLALMTFNVDQLAKCKLTAPAGANQAPPFDYNAWLKSAPGPVQEMVTNSTQVLNEEKQKLITEITGNKSNIFTPEQLGSKPLNELRGLAALAKGAQQNAEAIFNPTFYGAGMPTATANAAGGAQITPLELPSMNSMFAPPAEKQAATAK